MNFKWKYLPSYFKKVPAKLRLCYDVLTQPYFKSVPPGHFYSALPDMDEVARRSDTIFGEPPRDLRGLDLNLEAQRQLLEIFKEYYKFLPFERSENPHSRFFRPNGSFPFQDAFALYAMIRHIKPNKMMEIGCGASSCVTLDSCDGLHLSTQITFIEPYPDLLLRYLRPEDCERAEIKKDFIQNIPAEFFASLEANDILFIDTSHVSKIGSDVNFIFFEIIPVLKPGVVIHFHDIFYPFEYPRKWIFSGTFWNEAYLLRALLMFNSSFEILMFNSYLNHILPEEMQRHFPLSVDDPGASLWLRRR